MSEALLGAIIGAIGGFLVSKGIAKPNEVEELLRQIKGILEKTEMRTAKEIKSLKQLLDSQYAKPIFDKIANSHTNAMVNSRYKVPKGKVLYLLMALLNARHYSAGIHMSYLRIRNFVPDIAGTPPIYLYVASPDGVDHLQDARYGNILMKLPEGVDFQLYANSYTDAYCVLFGIEIDR